MSGRPSRHRRTRRQLQLPPQLPWFTEGEGNRLSAPDESAIASDSEDTTASTLSEETRNKMEQMKRRNATAAKRLLDEEEKQEQVKKKAKTNHGFNVWNNRPDISKGCVPQEVSSSQPVFCGRKHRAKVKLFCVGEYEDEYEDEKRAKYANERKRLSSDWATTYDEIRHLDKKIEALNSKFKSLGTCNVCMEPFDDDTRWPCILFKNDESHTLKVEKSNYLQYKYDSDTCCPINTSVTQICRHNLCRVCAEKLVDDNRNYYDIESVRVLPVLTSEAVAKKSSVSRLPTCPTCRKPFIGFACMKRVNNAADLEAYFHVAEMKFSRHLRWGNLNNEQQPRVRYWPRTTLDPVLDRQQRKMITQRYTILTPSVHKDHLLESGNQEDEAVKKAMNMLRAFVAYEVSEGKKFQQQEHELPKGFLSLINGAIDFMITQKAIRDDPFVNQKTDYVESRKKEFYSFVKIFNNVSRNFREYYGIPYANILSKTHTFIYDMLQKDRVPISIEEEEEEDMNGGSGASDLKLDEEREVCV